MKADAPLVRTSYTVFIGCAGAAVGELAGLPAGALIGASLAVSAAATLRLAVQDHPTIKLFAFGTVGISLGAGIGPGIIGEISQWAASIALLAISVFVTLLAASILLWRVYGQEPVTAVVAASPGTLTYAVAVAEEGQGDLDVVVVLQCFRVLVLATVVPVIVFFFSGMQAGSLSSEELPLLQYIIILVMSVAGAVFLRRRKIPAAAMLAGMVASSLWHFFDLAVGRPPAWALFLSFSIVGTTIGSRFSALSLRSLVKTGKAAVVTVAITGSISAGFASLAAWLTGTPVGQAWVAFAPGGVEAMAAIGLDLGYDPAYVAIHHFVRIVLLMSLIPVALRVARRAS